MFDQYVGIDWSGAKAPQRSHAIAYAKCNANNCNAPDFNNDKLSRTDIFNKLCKLAEQSQRTLAGIDCNFGYNINVGKKQFGDNVNNLDLWNTVERLNTNYPNFFAGNFWQQKPYSDYFWTHGKQPHWFNANELRRKTECKAKEQRLGIPESPFKLIGAKQVGKGGLAGMRLIHNLKLQFGDKIAIWPFEQNNLEQANLVITEIYPRLFIRSAGFGNEKIRTYDDLNTILNHFNLNSIGSSELLNDHLTDAIIASAGLKWFCENGYHLTTIPLPNDAINFEGWIFGVNPT